MADDDIGGDAAQAAPPPSPPLPPPQPQPLPPPQPPSWSDGGNERYLALKALSHTYLQDTLMLVVVAGYARVANPGIQAVLRQSHNLPAPDVLPLHLDLFQKPGLWPQAMAWVPIEYGNVFMLAGSAPPPPARVMILNAQLGDATLALVPV